MNGRDQNFLVVSRNPLPRFEHVLDRLVILPPLFRAVLRTPAKRIGLTIFDSWSVDDLEIKSVQLKSPPCLPSVEWFILCKPLQTTVICEDINLMSCTLMIMPPFLERKGNCKQFLVVYLVVYLVFIHLLRIKRDRVQTALLFLRQ